MTNSCGAMADSEAARVAPRQKRICCFELSQDESSKAKKIKYAVMVPDVRKHPDDKTHEQTINNRASFINVVDFLWRNPDDCAAAEKWCERRGSGVNDLETFEKFAKVSTFGSLDLEWKVGVILSHSKFTRGAVEAAWRFDSETVTQLFIYCGIYPSLKLNDACRIKTVLCSCIEEIMVMNGDRLAEWGDGHINSGNKGINWPLNGVYTLDFEETDVAQHCCHNPFEESVKMSKRTPVDVGFNLEKNWSDHEAYLECEDVKHVIFDFWKKQKGGPYDCKVFSGSSEAFSNLVARHCKAYTDQKQSLSKGTAMSSQISGFMKEQRQESFNQRMAKAREVMKRRSEALKMSRSQKLGDLVNSPSPSVSPSPSPDKRGNGKGNGKGKFGKGGVADPAVVPEGGAEGVLADAEAEGVATPTDAVGEPATRDIAAELAEAANE